jgi:hypothetical protein
MINLILSNLKVRRLFIILTGISLILFFYIYQFTPAPIWLNTNNYLPGNSFLNIIKIITDILVFGILIIASIVYSKSIKLNSVFKGLFARSEELDERDLSINLKAIKRSHLMTAYSILLILFGMIFISSKYVNTYLMTSIWFIFVMVFILPYLVVAWDEKTIILPDSKKE